MTFFTNSTKPCVPFTSHCARSRNDFHCYFCGIDTSQFSKEDWNSICNSTISQNSKLSHNYVIDNIQGMAVREQDYIQIITYKCTNCEDRQIERDDQR